MPEGTDRGALFWGLGITVFKATTFDLTFLGAANDGPLAMPAATRSPMPAINPSTTVFLAKTKLIKTPPKLTTKKTAYFSR
ncbi:MAG: hypothetical protein ISR47_09800 [Rhodospirillales bacterium]|nr:hypothetical protein [Rhodospirillales bacterium]